MNTRLLEIQKEEQDLMTRLLALSREREEILTGTVRTDGALLTFEPKRRIIRWNGGDIRLGKKGYKFIESLYFAKKRRLKIPTLEYKVWGEKVINRNTFRRFTHDLSTLLEKAKFPYRLIPAKSKERYERTEERLPSGGHKVKRIQSVIIGISLGVR